MRGPNPWTLLGEAGGDLSRVGAGDLIRRGGESSPRRNKRCLGGGERLRLVAGGGGDLGLVGRRASAGRGKGNQRGTVSKAGNVKAKEGMPRSTSFAESVLMRRSLWHTWQ